MRQTCAGKKRPQDFSLTIAYPPTSPQVSASLKPEWVREIKKQCLTAEVPFFFKEWGGRRQSLVVEPWTDGLGIRCLQKKQRVTYLSSGRDLKAQIVWGAEFIDGVGSLPSLPHGRLSCSGFTARCCNHIFAILDATPAQQSLCILIRYGISVRESETIRAPAIVKHGFFSLPVFSKPPLMPIYIV